MNNKLYHIVVCCIICLWVGCDAALLAQNIRFEANETNAVCANNKSAPIVVTSRSVEVDYQIPETIKKTIVAVELWYAQPAEGWKFYGFDKDMVSPVRFNSPCEGNYSFLIVVVDMWGRRSCGDKNEQDRSGQSIVIPPNVKSHLDVFIDHTSPQILIQCRESVSANKASRKINLRWVGFDPYLPRLPVNISWAVVDGYQKPLELMDWKNIAPPQSADGQIIWELPKEVPGSVMFRATIIDKGGNQDVKYSKVLFPCETPKSEPSYSVSSAITAQIAKNSGKANSKSIKVTPMSTNISNKAKKIPAFAGPDTASGESINLSLSPILPKNTIPYTLKLEEMGPMLSELAGGVGIDLPTDLPKQGMQKKLDNNSVVVKKTLDAGWSFQRGWFHCKRMEWDMARRSFEKALELDPKMYSARLELAFACIELEDFNSAIIHFEQYLLANPSHQFALIGLAKAQKAVRQDIEVSKTLNKLSGINKELMKNI